VNELTISFHRCGFACRWVPRVLGSAMLTATYIASRAIDPEGLVSATSTIRPMVVVVGAVLALWLVRSGSEVHLKVGAGNDGVVFRAHGRERILMYSDIVGIRYDGPMAAGKRWIPAIVLVDRTGLSWRIPALVEGCRTLLETILQRCGDSGVRAWADARRVDARIGGSRWIVITGYIVSVLVLSASILFIIR